MKVNKLTKVMLFILILLPTVSILNVVGFGFDPGGGNEPPDTTPPTVGFLTPNPGTTIDEYDTLFVQAWASDNDEVDRVRFYIDGNYKHTDYSSSYTWLTTVHLNSYSEGTHTLMVKAYDATGNYATASRTVTFDMSRIYAINVGCDNTGDPDDDILEQLANDANDWDSLFSDHFAYGDSVVFTGESCTRANVEAKFEYYSNIVDDNDVFVFTYAGHGNTNYLTMYGSGIFVESYPQRPGLCEMLESINAGKIFVFLSSCHAGTIGNYLETNMDNFENAVVCTASGNSGLAEVIPWQDNSKYTKCFLKDEWIRDQNSDLTVSIEDIKTSAALWYDFTVFLLAISRIYDGNPAEDMSLRE